MIRVTHQRNAIRQVLQNAGRPLSPHEIFDMAQRKVSGLGIATVYRNLKSLQEEGAIVAVELPGQPPRWEVLRKVITIIFFAIPATNCTK